MCVKILKLSMEQNTLLPFKELIVLTVKKQNQNIKMYKIGLGLERKCFSTEFDQFHKISLSG